MASSDVVKILQRHKSLTFDESTQKIKCALTNHEMPPKVEAIESYVNGKKYKRLAKFAELSYEDHKMHIVPSKKKKKENEMFCRLTLRHLEKTANAIQRHINGRKYKNALVRWNECQKMGKQFIPHIRRKAKLPDESDSDSVTSDGNVVDDNSYEDSVNDDEDEDDMSDLYPEADFQDHEERGDDEMTTENVPPRKESSKSQKKTDSNKKPKKVKTDGKSSKGKKGKKSKDKDGSEGKKKRPPQHNREESVVKKKIKVQT